MIEARLGQHKLDGTYPRVNVRLSLARRSRLGVWMCGWPMNEKSVHA